MRSIFARSFLTSSLQPWRTLELSLLDRMQYGPEYLQNMRGNGLQAIQQRDAGNGLSLYWHIPVDVRILFEKVLP
jgi:hypothetical protein